MSKPAMPVKLIVVIVLLGLSLVLDLYNLQDPQTGGTGNYIRIALNIGLLYGLLRGQEWARVLAKVIAILGLITGGIALIGLLSLSGVLPLGSNLMIVLYVSLGYVLAYSVFLLWCMSQHDVQDWLMSRNLRD